MRCLGRLFGLLLILLILIVTPCAFWTYNVDRVAMNPETYKTALRSQNFYQSLLPAFIDVSASTDASRMKDAARSLVQNLSPAEWALLSERLLPPTWLQGQLDDNIDNLFAWINGRQSNPDVSFDLTVLKQQLTDPQQTGLAVNLIVPKLPVCSQEQERILAAGDVHPEDHPNLLCNPTTNANREKMVTYLTQTLATFGETMPSNWNLIEELRKAPPGIDDRTGLPISAETQLNRIRSLLWLDSRLVILGFLVPIALFAIAIIVAIRSGKQFFRWLGWGLILSGFITLIPVPFLSTIALHSPEMAMGEGGQIVETLAVGILQSILSGINLAVFTQVAFAIVVGIIAVFVSVMLPRPDEVTRQEVAMERAQSGAYQANFNLQMGSTPRPYETATYTPPPAPPYDPADLDDLFRDEGGVVTCSIRKSSAMRHNFPASRREQVA